MIGDELLNMFDMKMDFYWQETEEASASHFSFLFSPTLMRFSSCWRDFPTSNLSARRRVGCSEDDQNLPSAEAAAATAEAKKVKSVDNRRLISPANSRLLITKVDSFYLTRPSYRPAFLNIFLFISPFGLYVYI